MICKNVKKCCEKPCYVHAHCNECRIESDSSNIVCQERKRRYNLKNSSGYNIVKFHMDGGVIIDEPSMPKCDYMLYVKDDRCPMVRFVELKGKDIHHAVEQIYSTLKFFRQDFKKT